MSVRGDIDLPGREDVWEDKWIDTTCGGCYCGCAARVRRINGVAAAIEGNPDSPLGGRGGMCGKGNRFRTFHDNQCPDAG